MHMNSAHAELSMTSHGVGKLYIDGEEVEHVNGVDLSVRVDRKNRMTVALNIPAASFDGDVALSAEIGRWPRSVQEAVLKALHNVLEPESPAAEDASTPC